MKVALISEEPRGGDAGLVQENFKMLSTSVLWNV